MASGVFNGILFVAAIAVAGVAFGAVESLSMGQTEAWTWVEVSGVAWSAWETRAGAAAGGVAGSGRGGAPKPRGAVGHLGRGVGDGRRRWRRAWKRGSVQ